MSMRIPTYLAYVCLFFLSASSRMHSSVEESRKSRSFFSSKAVRYSDIFKLIKNSDSICISKFDSNQVNKRHFNELSVTKIRKLTQEETKKFKKVFLKRSVYSFDVIKNCIFYPKYGAIIYNNSYSEKKIEVLVDFECTTSFFASPNELRQVNIDGIDKNALEKLVETSH